MLGDIWSQLPGVREERAKPSLAGGGGFKLLKASSGLEEARRRRDQLGSYDPVAEAHARGMAKMRRAMAKIKAGEHIKKSGRKKKKKHHKHRHKRHHSRSEIARHASRHANDTEEEKEARAEARRERRASRRERRSHHHH